LSLRSVSSPVRSPTTIGQDTECTRSGATVHAGDKLAMTTGIITDELRVMIDVNPTDLRVLALVGAYLPGYKSGGPIRTIDGMVDRLGEHVAFRIVTADRDVGDAEAYSSIMRDTWQQCAGARVYYASPASQTLAGLRRVIRSAECDILYLNSFFHPIFTIRPLLLRRLGLIPRLPTVIAPRGELSAGALALKSTKKRAYVALARALGLYRGVVWHASVDAEADEIRRVFGGRERVYVAANLRPRRGRVREPGREPKQPGSLRIAFLSRISRKKNLLGAIEALRQIRGAVTFDIYGPVSRPDDRSYWESCLRAVEDLPPNVRFTYNGTVPQADVPEVLAGYDLFILLTYGENFGHAIVDAFEAGCPVLISDRTPWRNLEAARAGWDVPPDDQDRLRLVLQEAVDMDQAEWSDWSAGARAYGCSHASTNSDERVEANRTLFLEALGLG
jgi:glycosyltransferase involved in cell wall biosynthesis